MKLSGLIIMMIAIIFGLIEIIKSGTINNSTLFLFLMGLGVFEIYTHD